MLPKWLKWARELQALSQVGLAYVNNPFDEERYEILRTIAAQIMADGAGDGPIKIEKLFEEQTGYATPKVDVRAAIFRERSVLLVSEMIDGGRWTLPGGWADVNLTPSENTVREVREEAGLVVKVTKLAAVYDRDKAGHPQPHPFHIYKMFFLCDILGECKKSELETGEARYFPIDELPELSESRVLPWQIHRMYEHQLAPFLPTDFN